MSNRLRPRSAAEHRVTLFASLFAQFESNRASLEIRKKRNACIRSITITSVTLQRQSQTVCYKHIQPATMN